ncbi:MAG: RNA polymerase sigma factor [Planctomycetota bacterium]|nr:MAG: RNA polymerase sigma factor [Planctomycetota bacterium]
MPRQADAILDDYIVLQAMEGVPEAWRQLVTAWHPLLLRRATRLLIDPAEAADATQDTWVAVARSLPRLEDPSRFAPWLYRILARRCADRSTLRSRRVERPHPEGDIARAQSPAPDTANEPLDALRLAMQTLPADQRVLLSMRYADNMPVRVIAEMLGIAEGTAKSRLFTAREALRALVEAAEPPPPARAATT